MSNVVSLENFRAARSSTAGIEAHRVRLERMSHPELLEEMVRYQEDRKQVGDLTLNHIFWGIPLFQLLEAKADTRELRILARAYVKHLQFELAHRRGAR